MRAPLEVRTHRQSKLGEAAEACEDVLHECRRRADNAETLRIALSDGATMTSFARQWAQLLTRFFAVGSFVDEASFARAILAMRKVWAARLPRDLPWHSEQKVAEGAGATLLVVNLVSNGTGVRWTALAVGDTCLLRYTGTQIEEAFPLKSSEQFDFTPVLISSADAAAIPALLHAQGTLTGDDVLVLATDALAKYLMEHDGEIAPVDLVSDDDLEKRFDDLRTSGAMKNDDIAIAVVSFAK